MSDWEIRWGGTVEEDNKQHTTVKGGDGRNEPSRRRISGGEDRRGDTIDVLKNKLRAHRAA